MQSDRSPDNSDEQSDTDIGSDSTESSVELKYNSLIYKYKCNSCKARFKTKCDLFRHHITHENFCINCKLSFTTRRIFRSHKCPVCEKCKRRFKSIRLITHLNKCKGVGPRVQHEDTCIRCLSCVVCKTEFACAADLRAHLSRMTYQCRRACYKCGGVFKDSTELETHMKTHAVVRSYSRKRKGTGEVGRIIGQNTSNNMKMAELGSNVEIEEEPQYLWFEVKEELGDQSPDKNESETLRVRVKREPKLEMALNSNKDIDEIKKEKLNVPVKEEII